MIDRERLSRSSLGPLDGDAARRATTAAVLAVVLLVVAQGAVSAAVTSGHQPMEQVRSVPTSPTASTWQDVPSNTVTLSKQQMAVPFGGGSTEEVTVQALTNESHVAFRLTWHDPTNDTSLTAPEKYSDAVAVMLRGGDQPPITMGAVGKPVNIWYWRATWQYGGQRHSEWSGDMYAYPHPDNETRPGLNANNPITTAGKGQYAQNYYATGFGSLTHAPKQNVRAKAVRRENEWAVTFVRERATNGSYDAGFEQSKQMYLAFAVWNGSADEVNGEKSITLRFSTLDTKSGKLSPPSSQTGGGSSAGGSSGGSGSAGDGGSTGGFPPLYRNLGTIVAVVLVTWVAIYWRAVR